MNNWMFRILSEEVEKMSFLDREITLNYVNAPIFESLKMNVFYLESVKFLEANKNDLKAIEIELNKLIQEKYYCRMVKHIDNKILILVSVNTDKSLYVFTDANAILKRQIKSFK